MPTFLPQNDPQQDPEILATALQVGIRIRQLRKALHLTQAEVAQSAGVSRQLVSAIERGHARAEFGIVMSIGNVVGLRIS